MSLAMNTSRKTIAFIHQYTINGITAYLRDFVNARKSDFYIEEQGKQGIATYRLLL